MTVVHVVYGQDRFGRQSVLLKWAHSVSVVRSRLRRSRAVAIVAAPKGHRQWLMWERAADDAASRDRTGG